MIGPQLFLSYNALLEKTEQKNFKKIKLRMAEIPETARTSSCIFIDHLLKFNFFLFFPSVLDQHSFSICLSVIFTICINRLKKIKTVGRVPQHPYSRLCLSKPMSKISHGITQGQLPHTQSQLCN